MQEKASMWVQCAAKVIESVGNSFYEIRAAD